MRKPIFSEVKQSREDRHLTEYQPKIRHPRTRFISVGVLLLLAACGGAPAQTASTALPTPTIIPTYEFVPPTPPPQLQGSAATATAGVTETQLDPQAVERGRSRYEALECGPCHGDNGEGTEDGSALTDLTMSEAEFISFMRSGGELGADHQYSTNRLSESGGKNLYQYLLSLRQSP